MRKLFWVLAGIMVLAALGNLIGGTDTPVRGSGGWIRCGAGGYSGGATGQAGRASNEGFLLEGLGGVINLVWHSSSPPNRRDLFLNCSCMKVFAVL